jgi:hypothetical protein
MAEPDRYESVLQSHLRMNATSWTALQSRGIDESTSMRLDFEFTAPGEAEVRSLVRHLRTATDYELQGGARNQEDGSQRWLVIGSTSPRTWSLEGLDEWVIEMAAHGRDHGPAVFDGWGVLADAPPGYNPGLKAALLGKLRRRGR